MGTIRSRAIIVESMGASAIMVARRVASDTFGDVVEITGVVPSTINRQFFFMIAPSGSAENHEEYANAESARKDFFEWVGDWNRKSAQSTGRDFMMSVGCVCVEFGEVDAAIVKDMNGGEA